METFTAIEYLLIDIANNSDEKLDKEVYQERIDWVMSFDKIDTMFDYAGTKDWKNKPLFLKAVMALSDVVAGHPTGHLVGFDAAASGLQINSVITSCWSGCTATGLVDQNRRANAYKDVVDAQQKILGAGGTADLKLVKNAAMTYAYGSSKEPEKLYGKGTAELEAFYKAMETVVPGAMMTRDETLNSWQQMALEQSWEMPDGCQIKIKNYVLNENKIKVDELGGSGFRYGHMENEGEAKGKKNSANVTHSLDAYLLRSLIRLCNYDPATVIKAQHLITERLSDLANKVTEPPSEEFLEALTRYQRSRVADPLILALLDQNNVACLSEDHLKELLMLCDSMLTHKPFAFVPVHDCFSCHPNNMNFLRKHYNEVLSLLARGRVLADILHQISDVDLPDSTPTGDRKLAEVILDANYAIT